MPKNELQKLYDEAESKNLSVITNSHKYDFQRIFQRFKTIENQDRPDGIVLVDNTVFVLEHFQISIYTDKHHQDLYQRAMGSHINYFKKHPEETSKTENLMPSQKHRVQSLRYGLEKHLLNYDAYMKAAEEKYPGKDYVFIIVVEDNSQDISANTADEQSISSILEMPECLDEILSYSQIDGIFVYDTSPLGDSIWAEDRESLLENRKTMKL